MPHRHLFLAFVLMLLQVSTPARAADEMEKKPEESSEKPIPTLAPVTVSASGLDVGSNEMTTPVTILEGDELVRRRAASLGETLAREPGIGSTHFGAGASRPIIRGMDGGRVKVLSDGSEIMDASTISPDHAVAQEPMLTRQIEVLRGPSALIYGGGAIGGIVNILDNKIPTSIPAQGVEGSVEIRGNTGAKEGTAAFEVTAGSGAFAVHAEGLKRDARNYKVGSGWHDGSKVEGSYNQTQTGSIGFSWIGARGYIGVAYTDQQNEYGLPGHEHSYEGCHRHGSHLHCGPHDDDDHDHDDHDHDHDKVPYIDLHNQRWDLRGEYTEPLKGFAKLKFRSGYTDYQHDEIEDKVVATRFKNRAHDNRFELEHHPIAGWRGLIGLERSRRDFSALGEEAYVEPTVTQKNSIFLLEEYKTGDWRFEAALRQEWQRIKIDDPKRANRRHQGSSLSAGAVWKFMPQYSVALSLSHTHRLPTAEELYAEGLHMATRTYEVGDERLKKETARNIDLTLQKYVGSTRFSVSAFHNRISNYIYGKTLDELNGLQLIQYTQRDATFSGFEGQIRQQLNSQVGITFFGDYVRARLKRTEENRDLPRIPPYRIGTRLDTVWQNWEGEVELYRAGRQNHVANFETQTPGYNMLNLGISYNGRTTRFPYQIYLKANNLTNKLAYNHASFIKRDAPLMGRNIIIGLRTTF